MSKVTNKTNYILAAVYIIAYIFNEDNKKFFSIFYINYKKLKSSIVFGILTFLRHFIN